MSASIKAHFGGETRDLDNAVERAKAKFEGFGRSAGRSARKIEADFDKTKRSLEGLKSVMEFGSALLAITGITSAFSTLIDHARTLKGEISENAQAVRRFGKATEDAKSDFKDLGVEALGALNRLGEVFGEMGIVIFRGRKEWQALREEAKRTLELEQERAKLKSQAVKETAAVTGESERDLRKLSLTELIQKRNKAGREKEKEAQEALRQESHEYYSEVLALEAKTAQLKEDTAYKQMSAEEQLEFLLRRRAEKIDKLQKNENDILLSRKLGLEIAKLDAAVIEKQGEVEERTAEKLRARHEESQKRIDEALERIAKKEKERLKLEEAIGQAIEMQTYALTQQQNLKENIADSRKDRNARSLSEIARGEGDTRASDQRKAQSVQRLEDRAARAQDRGNDDKAQELQSRADEIRGQIRNLNSGEKDPTANFREALKASEESLIAIRKSIDELKAEARGETEK